VIDPGAPSSTRLPTIGVETAMAAMTRPENRSSSAPIVSRPQIEASPSSAAMPAAVPRAMPLAERIGTMVSATETTTSATEKPAASSWRKRGLRASCRNAVKKPTRTAPSLSRVPALRARSRSLVKNSSTSGSTTIAQLQISSGKAIRQPNSSISQTVKGGVITEQILVPDSVTASAKPRPAEKKLATADDQTIGCISSEASAISTHKACQVHSCGPVKANSEKAPATAKIPRIATRRAP
jgi:hypothetical protein